MTYNRATELGYVPFLNRVHRSNHVDWYLEVGCRTGASAAACTSKTVLVDPFFKITTNVIGNKPRMHVFQEKSDEFFASDFLKANKAKVSFAFLDGMHLFEFLLRDFMNTEKNSVPGGAIAMHDCCPWNLEMTTRDLDNLPDGKAWTGDVWKLIPILQQYRPDLKIQVLGCRPTGLVIVTGLSPRSKVLRENYEEIVAEYRDQTIESFGPAKFYDSFEYHSPQDVLQGGAKFLDDVRLPDELREQPTFISP